MVAIPIRKDYLPRGFVFRFNEKVSGVSEFDTSYGTYVIKDAPGEEVLGRREGEERRRRKITNIQTAIRFVDNCEPDGEYSVISMKGFEKRYGQGGVEILSEEDFGHFVSVYKGCQMMMRGLFEGSPSPDELLRTFDGLESIGKNWDDSWDFGIGKRD
jgi:hypothetical protein